MYFVNNQNGNVYELTSYIKEENRSSPLYGRYIQATIKRLYDNMVFDLGLGFNEKYRPLTEQETIKLNEIRPNYETRGLKLNISNLSETSTNQNNDAEVGILYDPDDKHTLDRLIVPTEVKDQIQMGIDLITRRRDLDDIWGLNEIEPMSNKCIMNMVGPPGTGKTMTAKVIAKMVGKKLYQVDYSTVISKYVGDTAKNIKVAFEAAKRHNAILFFDEADSLMSKRISMPEDGVANSINQNRNVLMQELDRFDGIVLTSSNFFKNYDDALLRRISSHIHFDLPTRDLRLKLFLQHIPTKTKEKMENINFERLAELSKGLSGGDILVACGNSIKRAFSESIKTGKDGKLKESHLVSEIENIKRNKREHNGKENKLPF